MKKYILILTAFLVFNASADELPSCGENCTYEKIENGVDQNGNKTYTLKIFAIDSNELASIKDYERRGYENKETYEWYVGTQESAPWASDTTITKVELESGIASIGAHAFTDMYSVTEISLPEGLQSIGNVALHGTKITNLDLPDSLKSLGGYSLAIANLQQINGIPEGLNFLGKAVFATATDINSINIPDELFKDDSTIYDNSLEGTSIVTLYCSALNQDACEAFVTKAKNNRASQNLKAEIYHTDGNKVFYENHWYNNIGDILNGNHIKKRIYTIDEANRVAGPTNRISIRYR